MDRSAAIAAGGELEDFGRWLIRARRAQVLFRLGRRGEALAEAEAAVKALEAASDSRASWNLACARVLLGRMLVESGRPGEAEPVLAAALDYFAGDEAERDRRAEASCELDRARLLRRGRREDWRRFRESLAVYRTWGLADREALAAMEELAATP
jgi:hypothetical protein